jgi:hypothetical protein
MPLTPVKLLCENPSAKDLGLRMRRISKKRKKLMAEVGPWRESFRAELRVCEWCGKRPPVLHEISQGYGKRAAALNQRHLIVGLCDPGCHQKIHAMGILGKVLALAILLKRRPKDYNLELFWAANGRRWPEHEGEWQKMAGA